jgi:hypothetical protein
MFTKSTQNFRLKTIIILEYLLNRRFHPEFFQFCHFKFTEKHHTAKGWKKKNFARLILQLHLSCIFSFYSDLVFQFH